MSPTLNTSDNTGDVRATALVATPLDLRNAAPAGGTGVGTPGLGIGSEGEPSFTVTSTTRAVPSVAVGVLGDVSHTLTAEGADASEDGTGRGTPVVAATSVRRLTPVECERLQGLPDDWTRYGVTDAGDAVEQADSHRYRQVGNGAAVPVIAWIAARIAAAEEGLL